MPVKKKPSEAVTEWSKGIAGAVKEKRFVKGVKRAAKEGAWEKGATQAGDVGWKSGVDKAAGKGAFTKGVEGKGDKWASETEAKADEWATKVADPATRTKFESAITKVMGGITACIDDITPTKVEEFLKEVNPSLPEGKQMTASEARGYLIRSCLSEKKGGLKA